VKRLMDNLAAEEYLFKQAKTEGMQQGIQQGIQQEKLEIAKNMLAQGLDSTLIAQVTGLSLEVIKNLNH
jgi:predicted transposase/invertase (TIGR01784 family)